MLKTNLIEEHWDSDDDEPAGPPAPTNNEMLDMCEKMFTYLEINISRLQA
jgi:hypothetical protein